jgi:hypothetical protein
MVRLMEDASLSYGQTIYLIHYVRLFANADGRNETGEIRVVGSELTHLETRGAYYRVRTTDGTEGWVLSMRVAHTDPRSFFRVRGRELTGYLVSHMYPDYSGGTVTQLVLSDTALGDVHLETRTVSSISLGEGGRAEVNLDSGQRHEGTLIHAWLMAPGAMFQIDKARGIALDRQRA